MFHKICTNFVSSCYQLFSRAHSHANDVCFVTLHQARAACCKVKHFQLRTVSCHDDVTVVQKLDVSHFVQVSRNLRNKTRCGAFYEAEGELLLESKA